MMDLQHVETIVALVAEFPVSEVRVESEGLKVLARKPLSEASSAVNPAAAAQDTPAASMDDATPANNTLDAPLAPEPATITAGLVGLFRHTEPPIGYGNRVEVGDVVGSIEAMKVLNDVRAAYPGQITDILIEEGAPVEYGQSLFRLMTE